MAQAFVDHAGRHQRDHVVHASQALRQVLVTVQALTKFEDLLVYAVAVGIVRGRLQDEGWELAVAAALHIQDCPGDFAGVHGRVAVVQLGEGKPGAPEDVVVDKGEVVGHVGPGHVLIVEGSRLVIDQSQHIRSRHASALTGTKALAALGFISWATPSP